MELVRNRKSNIPISLHDSRIICMEYEEGLLRWKLDKMFQYTKECEMIYTGDICFTNTDMEDCSMMIFNKTTYEGGFSGKSIGLPEYIEQYADAEFEIVTEVYNEYHAVYFGEIWQRGKEPVSGIINIYTGGEIKYRIHPI